MIITESDQTVILAYHFSLLIESSKTKNLTFGASGFLGVRPRTWSISEKLGSVLGNLSSGDFRGVSRGFTVEGGSNGVSKSKRGRFSSSSRVKATGDFAGDSTGTVLGSSGGSGELKKSGEFFSGKMSGSVAEFSADFASLGQRSFTGAKRGSERTGFTMVLGEVWTLLHPKLTTVFLDKIFKL